MAMGRALGESSTETRAPETTAPCGSWMMMLKRACAAETAAQKITALKIETAKRMTVLLESRKGLLWQFPPVSWLGENCMASGLPIPQCGTVAGPLPGKLLLQAALQLRGSAGFTPASQLCIAVMQSARTK